jgi:hypothetical protein
MTPSEIEPATFRLVAQCLNQSATACPVFIEEIRVFRDLVPCSLVDWHQSIRVSYTLNCTSSGRLRKNLHVHVRSLYNPNYEEGFVVLLASSLR